MPFPSFHDDEYLAEEHGIEGGGCEGTVEARYQDTGEDYTDGEPRQTTTEIEEALEQYDGDEDRVYENDVYEERVYEDSVGEGSGNEASADEGSGNEASGNENYVDEGYGDENTDSENAVNVDDFPLPPTNAIAPNAGSAYLLQPLSELLIQSSMDLQALRNTTRLGATASASSLSMPATVRGGETVDFDLALENLDRLFIAYEQVCSYPPYPDLTETVY